MLNKNSSNEDHYKRDCNFHNLKLFRAHLSKIYLSCSSISSILAHRMYLCSIGFFYERASCCWYAYSHSSLTFNICSPLRFFSEPCFPISASIIRLRRNELINRLNGILDGSPLFSWNFPSVIDLKNLKIVDSL